MKNIVLLITILLFPVILFAQDLVKEGKEWSVVFPWWNDLPPNRDTLFYETRINFIQGDTLIEAIAYKKIYESTHEDKSNAFLRGYLREEGEKVYGRVVQNGSITPEGLLYDFSLQAGDSVYVRNYFDDFWAKDSILIYITNVKTDTVEGIERKLMCINPKNAFECFWGLTDIFTWFSGIGSGLGLLNNLYAGIIGITLPNLLCCKEDDKLIYVSQRYNTCYKDGFTGIEEQRMVKTNGFTIFPNPASKKVSIRYSAIEQAGSIKIINSVGKVVNQENIQTSGSFTQEINTSHLPKGVYYLQIVTPLWRKVEKMIII